MSAALTLIPQGELWLPKDEVVAKAGVTPRTLERYAEAGKATTRELPDRSRNGRNTKHVPRPVASAGPAGPSLAAATHRRSIPPRALSLVHRFRSLPAPRRPHRSAPPSPTLRTRRRRNASWPSCSLSWTSRPARHDSARCAWRTAAP